MNGTSTTIDPADLAYAALMHDLKTLDDLDPRDDSRRARWIASALGAVEVLEEAGGGSMGMDRLLLIKHALIAERSCR
jgi:hypothetical protein